MDDPFGGSPKRSLQQKDKLSSSQISCKICNKKFYSSQALGGHQNAHRQQRLLAKARSAQMEQPALSNMGKFYLDPRHLSTNSFSSPFFGGGLNLNSFDYRNKLGISMNSMMIHKPASFHPTRSVAARPGFNLFGHRHDYWMQPTRPAPKVFGNPKFGIADDNNNGWEGEKQERGEKIGSFYLRNKQPQASDDLDLTLKL